ARRPYLLSFPTRRSSDLTDGGYLGKLTSAYTGSAQENNEPVKFINCHFGSALPITNWVTVVEDECNVEFTNCTKDSNVTNLYFEDRKSTRLNSSHVKISY